MEKSKQNLLKLINLILIVVGLGLEVYNIITKPFGLAFIYTALVIIALGFSLLYMLLSYKKEAAKAYHLFMCFYAISTLARVLVISKYGTINLLITTYAFGIICILAEAKDLGKRNSIVLGGGVVALAVIDLVNYIIAGTSFVNCINTIAGLIEAVIVLLMIFAKYADKSARGSE